MDLTVPNETTLVTATLSQPDIHKKWEDAFRTPENARYYDMAFERVTELIDLPVGSRALDAGCGICDYAIRLARRGFEVTAIDFSESVIPAARANVARNGLADRIAVSQADILSLGFADGAFDCVLCWGVLMHIPDIDRALDELTRVLQPGGVLVISEGNLRSIQSRCLRLPRRLFARTAGDTRRTPAGLEHWAKTEAGTLLTREADIKWLVRRLAERGLRLRALTAGQFTELYTRLRFLPASRLIHRLNAFWFRYVRLPGPAVGNLLIFQRRT